MIDNIFFVIFTAIAVSYTWGMRGTIIGGEKGAMLPGGFLGLLLAMFSGSQFLSENPWLLAGAGALAMYCGGNMTYGETLGLSMNSMPPPNMKKGLIALFVKGGIWFSLFSGLISLFISALAGKFSITALILFFALLPAFALGFYFLLNKPHDKENGKFPRIYFSVTRKETWGGLFGILVEIIAFSIALKDYAALIMTAGGFISGAVGWVIGQLMQIYTHHKTKNGRSLFPQSYKNGFIDAWKIMECVLGAFGGLGIAITFILSKDYFAESFRIIDSSGPHSFIPENASDILVIVYCLILIADTMKYFISPSHNKRYNKKLLKMKLISKETYEATVYSEKVQNIHYTRFMTLSEKAEFALYSTIPLLLCFLGCYNVAALVAFPVVMLVLCQEVAEKCFTENHGNILWKLMFFLPVLVLTGMILIKDEAITTRMTVIMYTFFYEAVFFILKLLKSDKFTVSKDERTVHGYFITCCLVLNIFIII